MTEQELRIEFQRISEENNYLQMLNEDDAVDLCKSYANARESKEIAELKAKNAALVAALDVVKAFAESGFQSLGCKAVYEQVNGRDGSRIKDQFTAIDGTPYDIVVKALAANEKGGKGE